MLAILFFLFFLSISRKSNNPAALISTVGAVSGVVIGIGVAMIVFGWIGEDALGGLEPTVSVAGRNGGLKPTLRFDCNETTK